jgi:hypothetical protein
MVDGAISGATKRFAYIRNSMICNDLRVSGVVLAGCTLPANDLRRFSKVAKWCWHGIWHGITIAEKQKSPDQLTLIEARSKPFGLLLCVSIHSELEGYAMARRPKPWFRKERQAWFVTINGAQHNLGPDKNQAYDRFHELMRQPTERRVSSQLMAAIIDEFLDWCSRNRAEPTYEWYRYRLERFAQMYPSLRIADLRPFHVERWVAQYDFSQTSRRNYLRSVKRCVRWAKLQGLIDSDPIAELEVPSANRKEVVVSPTEYDEILASIRDDGLRDLIELTWQTGCRPQKSLRVEE